MSKDKIFDTERFAGEPFRFDSAVADVFPDMLRRSIPGYAASLEAIGALAARYVTPGSTCYDLGCSLGAAALAMRQGIRAEGVRIVAVDNSTAMIERCRAVIEHDSARNGEAPPIDVVLGDIRETPISDASMVVLNYTLQFLDLEDRDTLLRRIADALRPGGLLVLGEKVVDEDPRMEELLVDLYYEHKRRNDYSALEIARKRAALEDVLVPETVAAHRRRLETSGFDNAAVWFRYFNFVSIVAIKP
ncbi:MAG: carboxy-S-adenosyl-L-methionine synthase CmoA [Pseudomonadota bacterium]